MALLANNIISQNRTLKNPLSLRFSKHHHQNHPKFTTHLYPSKFQHTHHSKTPFTIIASITKTVSDAQLQETNSSNSLSNTDTWLEFARKVSGEWDGYGADFTSQGQPIELPESVVPEAYREWEVKVFDWQTQCPTLAQQENQVLEYKLIKLLPTVGCEADAATRYSTEERVVGGLDSNKVSAFAYQSSGCYVGVWALDDKGSRGLFELEHCLVDPRNRESRVRIIQVVAVEDSKLGLQKIKVFCEQWYGPFRNGEQLGGCAIRDSGFASTEALNGSQVSGVWQGPHAVATFQSSETDFLQELKNEIVRKSVRGESDLILLPRQLWCSLKEGEGGETCTEVGWLLGHESVIVSRCIFSSGATLKEIAIASETATSEGL